MNCISTEIKSNFQVRVYTLSPISSAFCLTGVSREVAVCMIVTIQTMRDLWCLWNHSIPRKQQGEGGSDAHSSIFRAGKEERIRSGPSVKKNVTDIHKVRRRVLSCLLCRSQEEKPALIFLPWRSRSYQRQD